MIGFSGPHRHFTRTALPLPVTEGARASCPSEGRFHYRPLSLRPWSLCQTAPRFTSAVDALSASEAWGFVSWPCSATVSIFSVSLEIHHDTLLKRPQRLLLNQLLPQLLRLQTVCGSGGFRAPGTPALSKCMHLGKSSSTRTGGVSASMKGCLSLCVCLVMSWDALQPPLYDPIRAAAAEDGRLYSKWCI